MVIDRRLLVVLVLVVVSVLCLGADNGVNPQRRFEVVSSNGAFVRIDTYTGKSWQLLHTHKGGRVWEPIYEHNANRTNGAGIIIRHGFNLLKNHRR